MPARQEDQPVLSTGIRFASGIVFAIILVVFVIFWEVDVFGGMLGPYWLGSLVYLPLLATGTSYAISLAIQYLSCQRVSFKDQALNVIIVPIMFYIVTAFLWYFPGARFPIEGMIPLETPSNRRALSSGFYTFLTAVLVQEMVNGSAQACPK